MNNGPQFSILWQTRLNPVKKCLPGKKGNDEDRFKKAISPEKWFWLFVMLVVNVLQRICCKKNGVVGWRESAP